MKVNKKDVKEDNGIFRNTKIIETTPADGFVDEDKISPVGCNSYGEYHKGYSKRIVYSTNDPEIARTFVCGIYGIFIIIGLLLLVIGIILKLIGVIIFGLFISIFCITGLISEMKNIDRIKKELKNKENENNKTITK